jgi:hypothetical protein
MAGYNPVFPFFPPDALASRQRIDVVMGDDFSVGVRNSAKSALEGRLLAHLLIAERP